MNRLTKKYRNGKITIIPNEDITLSQEAIDSEISASALFQAVLGRLYEYEESAAASENKDSNKKSRYEQITSMSSEELAWYIINNNMDSNILACEDYCEFSEDCNGTNATHCTKAIQNWLEAPGELFDMKNVSPDYLTAILSTLPEEYSEQIKAHGKGCGICKYAVKKTWDQALECSLDTRTNKFIHPSQDLCAKFKPTSEVEKE